ncbi:MAG: hypothetical protein FJ286_15405, partial [Planctomycetes bacterium]|nr:hypothetical protein [Planctomycetota bacterium]
SSATALTLRENPLISTNMGGRFVINGGQGRTFDLDPALAPAGATWTWRRNGLPIPGATGSQLAITAAAPLKDNGWYDVVVTSGSQKSYSFPFWVFVKVPTRLAYWGKDEHVRNLPGGSGSLVQVAGGHAHALGLREDGTVVSWGYDADGRRSLPSGLKGAVGIAAGAAHSLVLLEDGSVVGVGSSGHQIAAQIPADLGRVVSLTAGWKHSAALRQDGSVMVWGDNASGQTEVPSLASSVVMVAPSGSDHMGPNHLLVLRADGTPVAWGSNGAGQTQVPSGLGAVKGVAVGAAVSGVVKADGTVAVWGSNREGNMNVPVGLDNVVQLVAGDWHFMALRANGSVVSWPSSWSNYQGASVIGGGAYAVTGGTQYGLALVDSSGDVAPTITTQPASQTLDEGTPVTFSVLVNSGSAGATYQWRKGSTAISGATNASFTLPQALTADAGSYSVVVTNYLGSATSQAATLTITPSTPPLVTGQPQSITVMAGQPATFTVTSSGSPPRYQWSRNNSAITGATSATLAIPAVTLADAGSYTVQLTNLAGTVTSAAATLTVTAPPVIMAQPSSQTVLAGNTVTFAVSATGNPAPTYQWSRNGAAIASATNASLTLNNVTSADAGTYKLTATNTHGVATSSEATLTVNVPPAITTQPVSLASIPGASATFSVAASGFPAVSYQWYKGANPLPGANSASYTINPVSTADAGQYKVVVTNAAGTATSNTVVLTVNIPPVITTQPAATQSVALGTAATFIVVANGSPAPAFQWRKDGNPITGATSSVFSIGSAVAADAGIYTVVVSNAGGSVTSSASVLIVAGLPVITQQPASLVANAGGSATFSVTAGGTQPFTYQWRKAGGVISGATSASLTISPVQAADAGDYSVTVSNSLGSVTSSNATLTVGSPVVITTPPSNVSVNAGQSATLSVVATGSAPLTYEWRKNGNLILGASQPTYTIPEAAASDAGSYTVKVANSVNEVTSQAVTVTVNTLPVITTQPVSRTIAAGTALTLTVTATGVPPPTYQWKKDTVAIANATTATYTVDSANSTHAGSYTVDVSNSVGTVTSTTATATIISAPVITRQPATQTVNRGGRVTLTVTATGTAPLAYQWRRNSTPIAGATSASYRFLAHDATAESGNYDVVVTAGGTTASTTSNLAAVTVFATPFFGPNLTGVHELAAGEGITLTAVDTTTPAERLRWRRNGRLLPTVTGRILELTNLQAADAGWYQLQTTSTTGSVSVSAAVFLQVRTPSQTIAWGSNTSGQSSVPATLTDPLQVTAGYSHTLAIRSGGTVTGWGSNTAKQLNLPAGLTKVVQVAAGYTHSVALISDGTVTAWGETTALQNLVPSSLTGVVGPSSLSGVVGIAAGRVHTLALRSNGTVVGWGEPSYGQEMVPAGLSNIVAIAAGSDHSLALRSDGLIYAWGNSDNGRTTIPSGLTNVIAIAAGAEHSLALRADGRVVAWGKSDNSRTAVPSNLTDVVAIAAGQAHSVALKRDGTLVAWGLNTLGQTTLPYNLGSVHQLSAVGGFHNVALRDTRQDLAPAILTSPDNRLIPVGAPLTLAVTGNFGSAPLTVVWTKDNVAIGGATQTTYTVASANSTRAGVYQAKVTNYLGTATSGAATITVNAPLGGSAASILTPPAATTVLSGQTATLKVEAAGTPPLSYQWKLAGSPSPIVGATGSTLSLTNVTTPGTYTVDVTAAVGATASATTTVDVLAVQAGLTTVDTGYVEGKPITLQASLSYTGTPTSLAYSLLLPPGWSYVSSTSDAQVKPAAGSTDAIGWAWSSIPASPLAFNVVLTPPLDSVGTKTVTGTAIIRTGGGVYELPLPVITLPQVSAPRI